MLKNIIPVDRSVIVAADVPTLDDLSMLVEAIEGVPGIGGIKLGFMLAFQDLRVAVDIVRERMGPVFPVIYDHQKAGTDIPETGSGFAKVVKKSGVDAAILFPFAGPETQEAWTKACIDEDLPFITGGIMTHKRFLVSEGGYIADKSVEEIYRNACELSGNHFVVPGTKLSWVMLIRSWLVDELGEDNFVLYSPGLITQGGNISECGHAAGKKWHAIVGSAIYKNPTVETVREAAIVTTSQLHLL